MSLMLLAASFLMFRGFQHSLRDGTRVREGSPADGAVRSAPACSTTRRRRSASTSSWPSACAKRPGVESAALTQNPPLGLDDFGRVAFVPEGFQMPRDRESFTSPMDTVDEGFFETMGIPILRGRGFRASDTADAPRVAVVNEHFAKHYWPDADAVGKRIRLDSATGAPVEIVGVAQTIKYRDSFDRPMDFVYLPLAQHPVARMVLLLRSSGDPLQTGQAGEGRRPDARPEHADAGDEDLRGPLPLRRRGRAGRRGRARRHPGRGRPPARDRRPVRAGRVQREPPDARDRHPHGDRRAARATCCA